MRIFLLFLSLCACGMLSAADFRNVSWGMSPAAVKKAENAKLENETQQDLVYSTVLGDQPVAIAYEFENNVLVSAEYNFVLSHRETEKYVEDYDVLQAQLEKKYGVPSAKEQFCNDDFYANYPRRWGTAIVVGKLTRESVWNEPRVVVRHSIRALPGGGVGHVVEYAPPEVNRNNLQGVEVLGAL